MSPWRILGLALTAQIGFSVLDFALPALTGFLKHDLGTSAAVAGLAVSVPAFGKIFGAYTAGVAADRLGERRVLVVGGFVAAGLVALVAGAPIALLFGLLFLAGFAGGAGTPAGGRLVLLAFAPRRRGVALGIRQTGIPIGAFVAAAVLPAVAHVTSWRVALLAAAAACVAFLLPLTLTRIDREEEPLPAAAPSERGRAWNRDVVLLTLWSCLMVSGQFALIAFLALDVHDRFGLSLPQASLLVAFANLVGIAARVVWGALSDRFLEHGRKPMLLALNGVALVGVLALAATPADAPLPVLVLTTAVAGLGVIGYQGLWITMVAEAAGPRRVGEATGFAVAFSVVSIAVSPALYGLVADTAGSYRAIWVTLSAVVALAFVPAALVRERREVAAPATTMAR